MGKRYDGLQEEFNIAMDRLHPQNFDEVYGKKSRVKMLHVYGPVIYKWVVERSHSRRDQLIELCKLMANPKVVKALEKLIEDYNNNNYFDEDDDKIGIEFVVVINEILTHLKNDNDLYEAYYDIAVDLLGKHVDKLVNRTGIDEKLAINLLLILPMPDVITRDNIVGIYTNRIVRRMYSWAYSQDNDVEDNGLPKDVKSLKKLFSFLFGKDRLDEVAISVALEKRINQNNEQKEAYKHIYSLLTNFAVEQLEGLDKADLKDQISNFVERRQRDKKNNRDAPRRVQFNALSKDYENIHKVVKKLKKKNKDFADFL